MPAIRRSQDAKTTGRAGIRSFVGTLQEFIEDVEGEYGMQVKLIYSDVVVTESDDGFQPEDGTLTEYVKQSDNSSSLYVKKLDAYETFAFDHEFLGEDVWESFYGRRIEYKLEELIPGNAAKKMSPGVKYVPVRIVPDDEEVAGGSTTEDDTPDAAPFEPGSSAEPDDALVSAILDYIGEQGETTPSVLERSLKTKAATRKALASSDGIEAVLQFMVAQDMLVESDGIFNVQS